MSLQLNEQKVSEMLEWSYEKALVGIPSIGIPSAEEMAKNYLKGKGSLVQQVNSLIAWQKTKAGTSGFVSGVGGLPIMPLSMPANITNVLYVQLRMIAAIAYMGGANLKEDQVQSLVYVCLLGNGAAKILKEVGVSIGTKLSASAIKRISFQQFIKPINQKVGFRLLTKFGEKGAINIGKAIPLAGGVIGAAFDITSTHIIGNTAKRIFIESENEDVVDSESL